MFQIAQNVSEVIFRSFFAQLLFLDLKIVKNNCDTRELDALRGSWVYCLVFLLHLEIQIYKSPDKG